MPEDAGTRHSVEARLAGLKFHEILREVEAHHLGHRTQRRTKWLGLVEAGVVLHVRDEADGGAKDARGMDPFAQPYIIWRRPGKIRLAPRWCRNQAPTEAARE